MVWLEPAIYITYHSIEAVRVFADQAPFQELEPILIKDMEAPDSMTASAQNQTIYISDSIDERIWRIQLSNKKWTRLTFPSGHFPWQLSVTPKNELLVVFGRVYYCSMEDGPIVSIPDTPGGDNILKNQRAYFSIELFQLENDRRKTFIPLPKYIEAVGCVVQLLDENFVISHSNDMSSSEYFVSLVSFNDGKIIRTLDSRFFSWTCRTELYIQPHQIAVNDEGFIILADSELSKIIILNPQATEFSTISNKEFQPFHPKRIVYNNGRLLVQTAKPINKSDPKYHYIPVFSILRMN